MNGLLQHAVTGRAMQAPEATAIVSAGRRMSYGELEADSNRLARLLSAAGVARGDRVGILMPKQPAAIAAMLAALKADAIYVPLDPSEPPARLARILEVADFRCVLGAGHVAENLKAAFGTAKLPRAPAIGWIGDAADADGLAIAFRASDLDAFAPTPPESANDASDVAHILFTSGSTGTPKGVMLTHAGVLAFLEWAGRYFGYGPDDRIAQHAPLRFDLSTFDVFGGLRAGAELHLVPAELNLQPGRLAQFLRVAAITRWLTVPSTLNLMARFDAVGQGDFPELRDLLFAGEVLPVRTLAHWMRRLPHARFTNLYGPTETSIASTHYTVPACPDADSPPIPIGTANGGEEVLILDGRRRPVAPGRTGDIYIGGAGLAAGYWRDPKRTRRAFVESRDARARGRRIYRTGDRGFRDGQGLIHYVGRSDSQIKSRGYRIELGEIERAVGAQAGVQDAAVVAIASSGFEGALVCCAYVAADGRELTPLALRSALAAALPAYMLPARWQRMDSLPVNASGKCDRRRIQQAFQEAEAGAGRASGEHADRAAAPPAPVAAREDQRRSGP